ncbi:hypothetical protein [Fluviispira sanaruensis]|uniref:Porin n=1 Tax=Fluviispira sanaruensis TaxID=2493639 RepID=A0A4P2VM31_FLUSA|nr:hypothetical protein [Fluviispira sanaruensis]BBH52479.1 hypothetical protein JCM31447_317700 [Fluviispira sanaruensis]
MKKVIKVFFILFLLIIPNVTQAETNPLDPNNFTIHLRLHGRYDLFDTYRLNQFDLFTSTAQMDFSYRYKNIFGEIEFLNGSPSSPLTATSTSPTDNGSQNLFIIRRANLGVDFINTDQTKLTLFLGRDHNASSIIYAADAFYLLIATNIDGAPPLYSQDGVALKYAGSFDFGKINAAIGWYNNFPVSVVAGGTTTGTASQTSPFNISVIGMADNTFNSQAKTQAKAIAAQFGTYIKAYEDGVIELRSLFSMQGNAVTKVTSGSTYSARDTSNIEASLGYNYNNGEFKGGMWLQSVTLGATQKNNNTITSNSVTYQNDTSLINDDSFTVNTIGLGLSGNSKLFGFNSLLAEGDAISYAAGYQSVLGQKFSGGGGITNLTSFSNKTVDISYLNFAVGYLQGGYQLELNYIYAYAEKAIFPDANSIPQTKIASMLYLSGTMTL